MSFISKKLAPGDEVFSICTKCRLELHHFIVAMMNDSIIKVQCKTCGGIHNYRPAEEKQKKVTSIRVLPHSKGGFAAVANGEKNWEKVMQQASGKEVRYEMGKSYHTGDILLHNTFGKGVVQKTYSKKLSVLFRDKERILASGNV